MQGETVPDLRDRRTGRCNVANKIHPGGMSRSRLARGLAVYQSWASLSGREDSPPSGELPRWGSTHPGPFSPPLPLPDGSFLSLGVFLLPVFLDAADFAPRVAFLAGFFPGFVLY